MKGKRTCRVPRSPLQSRLGTTGTGFDDGTVVGQFDVVGGSGLSTFTTFADGSGLGATGYDFVISPGMNVDADYISVLLGPIGDLHFTSSQVSPPARR